MELRRQFLLEAHRGKESMRALCARFGISRKTGFKWKGRFGREGPAGLADKSRRPRGNARALTPEVVGRLVALRRAHPTWGPKKLRVAYRRVYVRCRAPAASTIGDVLKREGLVAARVRHPRGHAALSPFAPVRRPNEVWCIDFKGQFRLGDGRLCYALTVTDAHSRMLLVVRGFHAIEMKAVKRALLHAFRRYGLPRRLRSDNGPPFGSGGLGGLTQLGAWLLSLGVQLERIAPGKPQQNGQHERMHRTLKAECTLPPECSLARQQRVFDAFQHHFNTERPHEALGMDTPASRYTASARPLPTQPTPPHYPRHFEVRRVRPNGCVRWDGRELYVSAALVHRQVGFEPQGEGRWLLRYYALNLGLLDATAQSVRGLRPYPPTRASPMSPV